MAIVEIELGRETLEAQIVTARVRSNGFQVELVTLDGGTGVGAKGLSATNRLLVREEDESEVRAILEDVAEDLQAEE